MALAIPFPFPSVQAPTPASEILFLSLCLTPSINSSRCASLRGALANKPLHLSSAASNLFLTPSSGLNAHSIFRFRLTFSFERMVVKEALSSEVYLDWNLSSVGRWDARAMVEADEGIGLAILRPKGTGVSDAFPFPAESSSRIVKQHQSVHLVGQGREQ